MASSKYFIKTRWSNFLRSAKHYQQYKIAIWWHVVLTLSGPIFSRFFQILEIFAVKNSEKKGHEEKIWNLFYGLMGNKWAIILLKTYLPTFISIGSVDWALNGYPTFPMWSRKLSVSKNRQQHSLLQQHQETFVDYNIVLSGIMDKWLPCAADISSCC